MTKKQKITAFVAICAAAGLYLYINKKKEQEQTVVDSEGNTIVYSTNVKAGEGKG